MTDRPTTCATCPALIVQSPLGSRRLRCPECQRKREKERARERRAANLETARARDCAYYTANSQKIQARTRPFNAVCHTTQRATWTALTDDEKLAILHAVLDRGIADPSLLKGSKRLLISDPRLPNGSIIWARVVFSVGYHRILPKWSVVWHIDGDLRNDSIENLAFVIDMVVMNQLCARILRLVGVTPTGDAILKTA